MLVRCKFELMVFDHKSHRNWIISSNYDTKREAREDANIFSKAGFEVSISRHYTRTTSKTMVIYSTLNKGLKS